MRINRSSSGNGFRETHLDGSFMNILESITSNIELELLLAGLVPRLMEYTKSQCGAFYLANNATGKLEIKYSAGLSRAAYTEFDINIGEGLLGFAALKRDVTVVNNIPDDSAFVIKTFVGAVKPSSMMLAPVIFQDQLMGVLAFSSVYKYKKDQADLIGTVRFLIGAAVSNSVAYERSKRLTNELKFQNKLIADLNNDLEVRLAERSELINTALDGLTGSAVFSLDPNGLVIIWNKAAERIYGVTAKTAVGSDGIQVLGRGSEARAAIYRYKIELAHRDGVFTEKGPRVDFKGQAYQADITYTSVAGNGSRNQFGGPDGASLTCVNRISDILKPS